MRPIFWDYTEGHVKASGVIPKMWYAPEPTGCRANRSQALLVLEKALNLADRLCHLVWQHFDLDGGPCFGKLHQPKFADTVA